MIDILKILDYVGVKVAGAWGSVIGLTVVTINAVYWILAIPNLWTFSKKKLREWFCFCQVQEEEVEDNLIDMLYANHLAAGALQVEHSSQTAFFSNHI